MNTGIFYCYKIPEFELALIDWLVENPIRDWELEAEVGQQVWRVRYKADHPRMQTFNRLDTCREYKFFDVVFDDEVEEEVEDESQEVTIFWNPIPCLST